MGIRSGLYQVSAGYLTISRYFFYGLVVIGLLGTATGVFAQSPTQQQLTLTLSNVKVVATPLHQVDIVAVSGTVSVSGTWSGGPLHFGGWAYVVGENRFGQSVTVNVTLSSSDFNPSPLGFPSSTDSSFRKSQNGPHTVSTYSIVVKAYDQSGNPKVLLHKVLLVELRVLIDPADSRNMPHEVLSDLRLYPGMRTLRREAVPQCVGVPTQDLSVLD